MLSTANTEKLHYWEMEGKKHCLGVLNEANEPKQKALVSTSFTRALADKEHYGKGHLRCFRHAAKDEFREESIN